MIKQIPVVSNQNNKGVCSLQDLIIRVHSEPKQRMIYPGIKEGSVGFIFGPSKSGKTMFCEGMALSIAAGLDNYLGKRIEIDNRRVFFISLEEHYANRTDRNKKQLNEVINKSLDTAWIEENFVVVDDEFPRYIENDEQWNKLRDRIEEINPGIIFFDSLTHMYSGSIEDSRVAKDVMKNLRGLAESTKTTIVCIHHTHKMYDRPISLDTLAGSRVIAQEADFVIGINRAPKGERYIKEVAFRHMQNNTDNVEVFDINENCWPIIMGTTDEYKLLAAADGRRDDKNANLILACMSSEPTTIYKTGQLLDQLQPYMSKQTLHTNLDKLVEVGAIVKMDRGEYAIAA